MTKIFTIYGDKIFSLMPQQLFRKKIFGPLMAKNKVKKALVPSANFVTMHGKNLSHHKRPLRKATIHHVHPLRKLHFHLLENRGFWHIKNHNDIP